MGKLVLLLPDGTTLDIPLDRERVTIGRRADNDVCLPFPAVSGEHAAVVTILDDSFLEDQNSTNGTLVNGKPIAKHFLRDGDEIDIGRQKLTYFSADAIVQQGEDAPVRSGRTVRTSRSRVASPAELPGTLPLKPVDDGVEMPSPFSSPDAAGGPASPADLETLLGDPEPRAPEFEDHDEKTRNEEPTASERVPASVVVDGSSPSVRVETGPSAGRVFPIAGTELVIGRVGERVAAIRRCDEGYRLVPLEGEGVLAVNGAPVPESGSALHSGDAFDVGRTRLKFSVPD